MKKISWASSKWCPKLKTTQSTSFSHHPCHAMHIEGVKAHHLNWVKHGSWSTPLDVQMIEWVHPVCTSCTLFDVSNWVHDLRSHYKPALRLLRQPLGFMQPTEKLTLSPSQFTHLHQKPHTPCLIMSGRFLNTVNSFKVFPSPIWFLWPCMWVLVNIHSRSCSISLLSNALWT